MPPENSGDTDKASRRKDKVHSKVAAGQKASEAEEEERKLQVRMDRRMREEGERCMGGLNGKIFVFKSFRKVGFNLILFSPERLHS